MGRSSDSGSEASGPTYDGGCWIPAHVLADGELTASQKIFAGRVYALSNDSGYCWKSNPEFADEFDVAPRTIQRWGEKLESRGHVTRDVSRSDDLKGARRFWPIYPGQGGDTDSVGGDANVAGGRHRCRGGDDIDVAPEKRESTEESLRSREERGGSDDVAPELDLEMPEPSENGSGDSDGFPPASELDRLESGRIDYPDEFEAVWRQYPDRRGNNPKKGAYKAWRARVEDGVEPERLFRATREYAEHCRREGDVGSRYVMQAATFFGPEEPWDQEWLNQPEARSGADRRAASTYRETLAALRESDGSTPKSSPGSGP